MKTITEGLQEVKTIGKRIEKKREFVKNYLWRQNQIKDPHEKSGGTFKLIQTERQAIKDLEDDIIDIRHNISVANDNTKITVCGETKTISAWLIWKREIASPRKTFISLIYSQVQNARTQAYQKGIVIAENEHKAVESQLVINVDEKAIADEVEKIEEILSTLDGQLSLKNSTVSI